MFQPTYFAKLLLFLVVFEAPVFAFRVELYDAVDFKGAFYGKDLLQGSAGTCETLPPVTRGRASSLITEGCIMVFSEPNCEWYSYTIPAENHPNLDVFKHTGYNVTASDSIRSFKPCDYQAGLNPGNMDLYGFFNGKLDLMVEYRDLCECTDIPTFAHGQIEKVENLGNCFTLSDQTCANQGSATTVKIFGGFSSGSNDLGLLDFNGKTKSISPCDVAKLMLDEKCGVSLSTELIGMEITEDSDWVPGPQNTISAGLAAKTVIASNGSAKISQEFAFSKEVEEIIAVTRSEVFYDKMFQTGSVSANLNANVNLDFIPFLKPDLKTSLEAAYSYNQTTLIDQSLSTNYTSRRTKSFTVKEIIEIPGCTEYHVESLVKVADDLPIKYKATFNVKGTKGVVKLSNSDIIKYLGRGEIKNDIVVVTCDGTIYADVGFEAFITGDGVKIENCLKE